MTNPNLSFLISNIFTSL